ncbi:MAG: hypothetical protein Q9169_002696 [Polycauliona sp. 2 TL-2023]
MSLSELQHMYPLGNRFQLVLTASACASPSPTEIAPFERVVHRSIDLASFRYSLFLKVLNDRSHGRTLTGFVRILHLTHTNNTLPPNTPQKPQAQQIMRAPSSFYASPPTRLPKLPLRAPPATPRNACHLYGEFSWPSLDICTLVEKLEDVVLDGDAVAVAVEEEVESSRIPVPSAPAPVDVDVDVDEDFADMLIARYGDGEGSMESQSAIFSEILALLEVPVSGGGKMDGLRGWLDGVGESEDGSAELHTHTHNLHSHANNKDEDKESYLFTSSSSSSKPSSPIQLSSSEWREEDAANTASDGVKIEPIADNEWIDDEDRKDMGEFLEWFGALGESVGGRLMRVYGDGDGEGKAGRGRGRRSRRMGGVFGV